MNTNVVQTANIPAGIFGGCELLIHQNQNFALHNGSLIKPNELPVQVEQLVFDHYKQNKKAHKYLKQMGYPGVKTGYEKYKSCLFGGFDSVPDVDLKTGAVTPDFFNASCTSETCQFRGKLCGTASAISKDDYKTLIEIISGNSAKIAASGLHLSTAGLKSRIEKLKEKLDAVNIAELAYKAAQLGINASATH